MCIRDRILPHLITGEGERRDIYVVEHLPVLHVDDLHAHHGENLGNLQPLERAVQAADIDIKFLFQKLQQRGVDGKILVGGRDCVADAPLALFERNGLEDERRVIFLAVLAGRCV